MTPARFLPAEWARRKKFLSAAALSLFSIVAPCWPDDPLTYEANSDMINLSGYVLLFDAQGPLSYASATSRPEASIDVGEVRCQACEHGVSLPFTADLSAQSGSVAGAMGKGGFVNALNGLKKKRPEIQGLYDVRVDMHQLRILGIYSRLCTEVTARAFARAPSQ